MEAFLAFGTLFSLTDGFDDADDVVLNSQIDEIVMIVELVRTLAITGSHSLECEH